MKTHQMSNFDINYAIKSIIMTYYYDRLLGWVNF